MMKRIIVPHGENLKLAQDFKVSIVSVRSALRFKTNSRLAIMIRRAAIERGGKELSDRP